MTASRNLISPPDAGRSLLALCVAFVVGLVGACLMILAAGGVTHAVGLGQRLSGASTLAVCPPPLESPDITAARAVELLASTADKPVAVRPLDPDPSDAVIGRTMGLRLCGGSAPRLLSLSGLGPDVALRRLRAAGIEAAADDHDWRTGPLERQMAISLIAGLMIALAMSAMLMLAASIAAARGVSRNAAFMELALRLGAREPMLWRPVRLRLTLLMSLSSAVGATLIAAALSLPGAEAAVARVSPWPLEAPWSLLTAGLWPLFTAAASFLAAGAAARRAVGGLG